MVIEATNNKDAQRELHSSLEAYAREASHSHNRHVMDTIGRRLCDAFAHYRKGEFSRAANLLLPVWDSLRLIGGSFAQRDLFEQLLLDSLVLMETQEDDRSNKMIFVARLEKRQKQKPSSAIVKKYFEKLHRQDPAKIHGEPDELIKKKKKRKEKSI